MAAPGYSGPSVPLFGRARASLLETYPEGEALREFIERQIAYINAYYMVGSPYVLYRQLVNASPALSRATVADALARPDSVTMQFAGDALAKLMQQSGRWTRLSGAIRGFEFS
jgi:hypothetical protein